MTPDIQVRVHGKWILAGEHAVLRGSPALVFPVYARSLELRYFAGDGPLTAEFGGEHGRELELLFWGVIERALIQLGQTRDKLRGCVEVRGDIPVGAGLGASAALCVGVGRWLASKGWVREDELYEFARLLENLFHGESSGVDIAVALSGSGLRFERGGTSRRIEPKWHPRWYLSYSGKRGVTSECVAKVKSLWECDGRGAAAIDEAMRNAVAMAERALLMADESNGFALLAEAIHNARLCFDRWGLAAGELGQHLEQLQNAGATAVKPTGSGGGGFVLSLWAEQPPSELLPELIPIEQLV